MTATKTAGKQDRPFWAASAADIAGHDGPASQGLTSTQAGERLARFGPNTLDVSAPTRWLVKILRKFAQPLVLILLVAALVSGLTHDPASVIIILAIVLVSIGLDVVQESGAERAAAALRQSIAIKVAVLRDGRVQELAVGEIVPGDVVDLSPGDLVPADGIVLESRSARVNEALLTGEPYPVEKRAGPSGAADPADAHDALFGGTALVSGSARMLVAATGRQTQLGGIAAALRADEPPTAFERGLHALGILIVRLTVFLVLFVLLAQIGFHRPPLESFLFAVALAVGLTPELLPMVTTVTLSRGAVRMAKRQVIVRKLAVIHDLGAMDVLCTDKTGTLTEARIEMASWTGIDGQTSPHVLELAGVNSRFDSGVGSPLDEAILARANEAITGSWRRIADLPFDFERRRAAVVAEKDGQRLLIVKGAPEAMLAVSRFAEGADGQVHPLDADLHAQLEQMVEQQAAAGFRMLGIAMRPWTSDDGKVSPDDERELVFVGFCAFLDPPKTSASAAIARLQALNVRVKIISGDAAPVVRHLVQALALDSRGLLTGDEIAALSHEALIARVKDTDLFARVSPDQKMRIIRALSEGGHTVGFLGDGINDAPAIKAADAGISVESATDVARAAADLILLAPDLGVLADGVEEGRRTYANITKYLRMGTSSNFGNMLSMALASLVIPFLPLTAIQILLNNLLYDLSEIGIPFDYVDDQEIAAPHNWDMRAIMRFTAVMGPLSSLFDIATFGILLLAYHAGPAEFRTAWFVESIVTQILVIFIIRTRALPWRSRPHPMLAVTSLSALAVALFAALGPFAGVFGFAPLPGRLLLAVAGLAAIYLVLAQSLKHLAMRQPGTVGTALGVNGELSAIDASLSKT
ncbi:magnesium-translocating P-type ATPase [Novosphingobium sp. KCTC 2891]|uniref:magnesium-translocating P-type ATPase n=1 Tax=Novosphingobium sp. KCTC 2891 TaxID=2989730 RepID=UPI002221AF1E|nr:magnesium-translocating P-type ATPase [Novosphingobium sp. KCTC 2891]MCW1381878.1 magnesium-translocating P-type ATPase [Novosphingobium sp. KCTC 2891]